MKTKEVAFAELFRVLEEERVHYALIGGVAVQAWRSEPRTTLDIDVAVRSYDELPCERLVAAGFRHTGRHAHSDNWIGPDETPVQFSDGAEFEPAIATAVSRAFGASVVRVAAPLELVRAKLRAAGDASRRRSKRLQDLADAQGLVEEHESIEPLLTDEERRALG